MPHLGGFLHGVLLDRFAQHSRECGVCALREFRVTLRGHRRYIDLYVPRFNIAVEAETSLHRVVDDLIKAKAADARYLFVVLPTASLARGARKKLARHRPLFDGQMHVQSFGPAFQRFRELLSSLSGSIRDRTLGHQDRPGLILQSRTPKGEEP